MDFHYEETIKADTPLSAYEKKNLIAFTAVRNNIVCYDKNRLVETKKIFWKNRTIKIKKGSENHISMNL